MVDKGLVHTSKAWPVFVLIAGSMLVGLLPWFFSVIPDLESFGFLFAPLCHQRPERTLVLNGALMVVCSRCAGIYAGLVVGAGSALFLRNFRWFRHLAWFAVGMMFLEVFTQTLGRPPWHLTRVGSGLFVGFVIAAWVPVLLFNDLNQTNADVIS